MAFRRKVFRIEESAYHLARDPALAVARDAQPQHRAEPELQALRARVTVQTPVSRGAMERAQLAEAQAFGRELGQIQDAIARTQSAVAVLGAEAPERPEARRLGRELAAIVSDAERSVGAILHAAEDIDRAAADLSAIVQPGRARGLSDEIRCHVGQILEACGFHDLTGQRVSNVQAALARVEAEIAHLMEVWRGIAQNEPSAATVPAGDDRRFLNGPKLDGDSGHSSQGDVDAVFGRA